MPRASLPIGKFRELDSQIIHRFASPLTGPNQQVRINELPEAGANVRSKGQDIEAGDVVVAAGEKLTPERLSLIASVGVPEVSVFQPLKIAVLSTGDELVEPGRDLTGGQIYNSNRYALAGMIRNMGMQVVDLGIVADNPEETDRALQLRELCL